MKWMWSSCDYLMRNVSDFGFLTDLSTDWDIINYYRNHLFRRNIWEAKVFICSPFDKLEKKYIKEISLFFYGDKSLKMFLCFTVFLNRLYFIQSFHYVHYFDQLLLHGHVWTSAVGQIRRVSIALFFCSAPVLPPFPVSYSSLSLSVLTSDLWPLKCALFVLM